MIYTHSLLVSEKCEILIIDTQILSKEDDMKPTLVAILLLFGQVRKHLKENGVANFHTNIDLVYPMIRENRTLVTNEPVEFEIVSWEIFGHTVHGRHKIISPKMTNK